MHVSVNLISLRDFKLSSRVMLLQTIPCLKSRKFRLDVMKYHYDQKLAFYSIHDYSVIKFVNYRIL